MSVAHPRSPLETVIDALAARGKRPRGNDRGWTAQCPAHDDGNPSLSISSGNDGRVLLHCHAGCPTSDILTALELTVTDLFAAPSSNGHDDTVAIYPYVDETDELLFQVVRRPGKQFRQRRPDGAGGWIWSLGDTRRVLYRLPQVLNAISRGDLVFIVEGEKDADRLAAAGETATCNPHGAGKWRPEYNQTLKGARVAVIADRDEPGRAHAQDIAHHLTGIAAEFYVYEAHTGKDISDHLAAGHTIEDLIPIDLDTASPTSDDAQDVPEWAALVIDGKTWLTSGPDHPDPLWGDNTVMLAARGQPTTIAGPQGAGKSVFGQRLALGHIGLIDTLLDIPIAPGTRNVLYLASDRPEQARLSTRRMITEEQLDALEARMRVWKGPPPEDVAKQPLMLRQMAEVADADLIVIDSAKDVALKLSADEVGAAYNSALQHCVANGIEVIALHHPRKLSGDTRDNPVRVLDDLYGAYWITAGNGSVIYLQPGDFDSYTLTQLKSPNGHKADIAYEHVTETGELRAPTTPDLEAILEEAGFEGVSGAHVARCLYKTDEPTSAQLQSVRRALHGLLEDGVAEMTGRTKNSRWRLIE